MLDESLRRGLSRLASGPAKVLQRLGVTPNQVTVAACLVGLTAAGIVTAGYLWAGAIVWVASRILDGYDGLLARLSNRATLFGGYLDITLDMFAYSAMAVAFAFAMPDDRLFWLLVLTGYVMSITTTLALSSLLERANRQLPGNRAIQFTPALAEGGETSIVYVLIGIVPGLSRPVLVTWIVLLAISVVSRTIFARRVLRQ